MTTRNLSAQLASIVERAIEVHKLEKFAEYWELYADAADVQSIKGFFVRTEPRASFYSGGGYCNVAIIGDGLLIDIEGNDNDNTGNLTFQPLESISAVRVRAEPLRGLDHSRDALLVVLTNRVGEEGVGLHWVAKTEEDEEHLLAFAKALVKAISEDRS